MADKAEKITFPVSGMHCASCAMNIERKLKKVPGVKTVAVSYATGEAKVERETGKASDDELVKAVKDLGYQAQIGEDMKEMEEMEGTHHNSGHDHGDHQHGAENLQELKLQLSVGGVLTALLLVGAMLPMAPGVLRDPRVMFLLATPVQFWLGGRFYKSAWMAAKNLMTNMDTLVALGTSVAYFFSVAVVLFADYFRANGVPTHVYFETASTIIVLILLGKFLEARARSHASEAIQKLLGLQAKKARVIKRGKEVEVELSKVRVGDVVVIKPGEKIPVDGKIVRGEASINESMVTGESLPVVRKKGNKVIGATVNLNGNLQIRVEKTGEETFLAQIIEMVKEAQSSKAPIQRLADQISGVFVPAVIVLAVITFVIWYLVGPEPVFLRAMLSLISVLIIACPCALGLATPTSIIVGVGRGAQKGILIKDAGSLELIGKVKTVVFDKTGTLTEGKPQVQDLVVNKELSVDRKLKTKVLEMVAAVEKQSHHPLAQAVVEYLQVSGDRLKVTAFKDVPGRGVWAEVNDNKVMIGTHKWMTEKRVYMNRQLEQERKRLTLEGKTVSVVSVDREEVAIVAIADAVKDVAKETVRQLKKMGVATVMLTGDNQQTAKVVGKKLGITRVEAEVLPSDKQRVINNLKREKGLVAMVGDGINDAPALAAADVGMAMGMGTDVAIETASVTLLRSDISLVPATIKLSRSTLRNIYENLTWAFGYNILLIPVAMGVLYPLFQVQLNPMIASGAMAMSSVSVVANALRLKKIKL